ncbi:unnamed protein product, partial [Phaeothamnion confervicola]
QQQPQQQLQQQQQQQQQQRSTERSEQELYEEALGTSVMCIKCRKALDDLGNIAEVIQHQRRARGRPRVQCQAYRLLLPNPQGQRPPRSVAWVRAAMRAILRAKVWDDAVLRHRQESRVRFPEFVYAWFEPPRASSARAVAGTAAAHAAALAALSGATAATATAAPAPPAEARIFWTLLDETHGEDFLTFLIYCLAVVE